ncbi:MAG TPA: 50S ribosomal protein L6 [Bacillota bacterium]|jgi:large subunit ribosomal protein L6|nr:50S ribosomal protein L6 [Bacillota bacterium]HOB86589.1 50S ribosomal protein L6 [Bacillota bacterium]HOP68302.1 50S ribosomal protein L6 [Bacillota bacterium]HPT33969.1 50S ribosomal protein L6 [Bacillota bacterium]HPZ65012.1 50S ribosomal protein L6 [Bacillota bacterium]
MSRTGRKPIPLPGGVQVQIAGNHIKIKGPKGELEKELPPGIAVEQEEGQLLVKRPSDSPQHRSLHGLVRSLIHNMVVGVTEGFSRTLELVGVGYRASMQGNKLVLNIGFSHPVVIEPEPNLSLEVSGNNKIVVKGIDKQQVGDFAARIRKIAPPEPYKGKGIRYENEHVRHKVGKAGK